MSNNPDEISITWHIEDVDSVINEQNELLDENTQHAIRMNPMSEQEKRRVLELVRDNHDANIGVNWENIAAWIDHVIEERGDY